MLFIPDNEKTMIKKTQILKATEDNISFGLSHDYCSDGNILAVRSHNKNTKQDVLYVYENINGKYELKDTYMPSWWKNNWQVAIKGINDSIYFVAVDCEIGKGHVVRYSQGQFRIMFTVDNCEPTLGMNDKAIAVDKGENFIAVTHHRVHNDTDNHVLLYSAEILLFSKRENVTRTISTNKSKEYSRQWSFRSLAFANNQLIAGSPDLEFTEPKSGTMEREYYGNNSYVDTFDLSGSHLNVLKAKDATPGNFYGTELEVSGDENTLIIMSPAQDHKIGAAYRYNFIDGTWVQTGKFMPRNIPIHTTIKYSLYGCCICATGSEFILSDGLYGALYFYRDGDLVYTHKESHSNYNWFGYDLKSTQDFSTIAVIESNIKYLNNSAGAVHIFERSDK